MQGATETTGVALPPIVLLVDQYGELQSTYGRVLESAGLWVSAAGVAEGFETARDLWPDVIVTDADLKEASAGFRFLASLCGADMGAAFPLIALTEDDPSGLPALALECTSRCLVKPVAPPALLADIQQLLLQDYAAHIRAERGRGKRRELEERAQALVPAPADAASATRTCPGCGSALAWLEQRAHAGEVYDYYAWCANRCGLFCYARGAQHWIAIVGPNDGAAQQPDRRVPVPTPGGVQIVTDRHGYILTMEPAAAALLNLSVRHAVGSSLLRFFEEQRAQLAEDLRRVGRFAIARRSLMLRPRERRPRRARVSLFEIAEGVLWIVECEPTIVLPARRRRRSPD